MKRLGALCVIIDASVTQLQAIQVATAVVVAFVVVEF